jgi:hypothetical protein
MIWELFLYSYPGIQVLVQPKHCYMSDSIAIILA